MATEVEFSAWLGHSWSLTHGGEIRDSCVCILMGLMITSGLWNLVGYFQKRKLPSVSCVHTGIENTLIGEMGRTSLQADVKQLVIMVFYLVKILFSIILSIHFVPYFLIGTSDSDIFHVKNLYVVQ